MSPSMSRLIPAGGTILDFTYRLLRVLGVFSFSGRRGIKKSSLAEPLRRREKNLIA